MATSRLKEQAEDTKEDGAEGVGEDVDVEEGEDVAEYPLVTLHEVKEGGLIDRMMDYVSLKLGLDD